MLQTISSESIAFRFELYKKLNEMIAHLLPLVSLKFAMEEWSIAHVLFSLRLVIFYDVKDIFLNDVMFGSRSLMKRQIISLNRHQSELSLFQQVLSQIRYVDPLLLRHRDRAFEVKLENEGAQDVGGPYRDCITTIFQVSPNLNYLSSGNLLSRTKLAS